VKFSKKPIMSWPTPRQQFQAVEGARKRHADLITRAEFQIALDHAMLEYVYQQSKEVSDNSTAVAYRLQGAQQFLSVFLSLANLPTESTRPDLDNLRSTD